MSGLDPSDELDHFVGPTSAWSETWEFRAAAADLSLAVVAAVVRRPAEGRVSYWAAVLGRSRPTVTVVEHEIEAPRVGLELRASGIWADHVCEEPHRRWTLGLEAFALALDDPADVVSSGRGLPVPLGFDLEWETPDPPATIRAQTDSGYIASGAAHGEVLVGEAVLDLDAPAHRLHRWGTGPAFPSWWSSPRRSGWGDAPWPVEPAATAYVVDALDQITQVVVGQVLTDSGPDAPGWASAHMALPEG
jgi:hypothetical protein